MTLIVQLDWQLIFREMCTWQTGSIIEFKKLIQWVRQYICMTQDSRVQRIWFLDQTANCISQIQLNSKSLMVCTFNFLWQQPRIQSTGRISC